MEAIWLNEKVLGFANPHSLFCEIKVLNERCWGEGIL